MVARYSIAPLWGGNDFDSGYALAVDGEGNAVVTGVTRSADFPTTPGAYDTSFNHGGGDVFVMKLAMRTHAFLPLVSKELNYCFGGPWESEPNNTYLEANGPLCSGRDYYGYPDDEKDYFSIYSSEDGDISIDLANHTGQGVQVQLFYQSVGNRVAYDLEAPYHIDYTGPAGWYYIYLYTESGFNSTTPYTLRVTVL
jgi:hypothetical protein